jgi:hypothetical protein
VTCPLHNWVIGLQDGEATGADKGCVRRFPVRLENGRVFLSVRPIGPEAIGIESTGSEAIGKEEGIS